MLLIAQVVCSVVLVRVLAKIDPLEMAAARRAYSTQIGRDLQKDSEAKTSSYFRHGLLRIIDGPLGADVRSIQDSLQRHKTMAGLGSWKWLLDEAIVGRSNADLNVSNTNAHSTIFSRPTSRKAWRLKDLVTSAQSSLPSAKRNLPFKTCRVLYALLTLRLPTFSTV